MDKFGRLKGGVTYLLNDKAKARIVGRDRVDTGCVSSGSEHSGQADEDVSDASFYEIFFGAGAGEGGDTPSSAAEGNNVSDSDRELSMCDSSIEESEIVRAILVDQTDQFRKLLERHVLEAVEAFSGVKSDGRITRRKVAAFLRDSGYNAAVCRTRWERSGGITAGNYEFIDVVVVADSSATRYFVDLEFAADFEIARPTSNYEAMLRILPEIFVGKGEDLKMILKSVSAAAKRSLASVGLHRPPWRAYRFMTNKWLGAYRRSTNVSPAPVCPKSTAANQRYAAKCRAVGFDAAVYGGRFLVSATASTS